MLHDLAARDDVIALALHVDYWDYIGWADNFADPAYTQRQQAYARVAQRRMIYTPQMVIGGQGHVVGAKPMELAEMIMDQARSDHGIRLNLSRNGSSVRIQAQTDRSLRRAVNVQLIRFNPEETVNIRRGENAGETISYANIVTSWQVIGDWSGSDDWQRNIRLRGNDRVAVIVQEHGPGEILAAQILR